MQWSMQRLQHAVCSAHKLLNVYNVLCTSGNAGDGRTISFWDNQGSVVFDDVKVLDRCQSYLFGGSP